MAKSGMRRADPMERAMISALGPGHFVSWADGNSFVSGLRAVEEQIEKLIGAEPARAAGLYESFIAGCTEKAEEVDDSDGELGTFAGSLFGGWIKARQAAGEDPAKTAKLILEWMEDDPYGFCNDLGVDSAKVLDKAGQEAFEREVRARFDAEKPSAGRNYARDRWGGMPRVLYVQRRNIEKYVELTIQSGLTQADCHAIATMWLAKRKPTDALVWVERGLAIEKPGAFNRDTHMLTELRRSLLAKVGRGADALESAWDDFQEQPHRFTYEELFRYVPKAEHDTWHERAMTAAAKGDLASVVELWLSVKEIGLLVERLERTSDEKLKSLSHYVTEPAAGRPAKNHPGAAARLFRALCLRILDAGKSKYYSAALSHLEQAKNCYMRAGLETHWAALVETIGREHRRKSGFMPGFEERARRRWTPGKKSTAHLES